MRTALEQQRTTSHEIVMQYLARIATYEDKLHAVITVNPRALAIADSLDRLRAQGRILGPLHGIPVALKDNIHTTDMPTTGGALAFADLVPPYEATLTKNLEAAGAIIIAKTQLTELANWVASGMPGNYNGLNGYGMNPWDPRRDPRDAFFDGRPVLDHRRIELRRRHERELLGGERRHGDVGLDPQPVESEHARRHQADRRPREPVRRHSDHGGSGHAGSDGALRLGRGDHARRAGRRAAGSERSGDAQVSAAGWSRLYEISKPRRSQGRAHRHSARVLLRRRTAGRRARAPRGGLTDAQRKMMDDVIAVLKAQGAVDRRSRRHPERHRHRTRRTTSSTGIRAVGSTTPRVATPTARSRSSTA